MPTEQEAAKLWCPWVRLREDDYVVIDGEAEPRHLAHPNFNRHKLDDDKTGADTVRDFALCCVGSHCMAWRWMRPYAVDSDTGQPEGYCGRVGQQKEDDI